MTLAYVDDHQTSNLKSSPLLSNLKSVQIRHDGRVRVERIAGIPVSLIERYASAVRRRLQVENVDGSWFAEVRGLEGIYGEGETRTEAVDDFVTSLPKWIELKIRAGADLPEIGGESIPTRFRA